MNVHSEHIDTSLCLLTNSLYTPTMPLSSRHQLKSRIKVKHICMYTLSRPKPMPPHEHTNTRTHELTIYIYHASSLKASSQVKSHTSRSNMHEYIDWAFRHNPMPSHELMTSRTHYRHLKGTEKCHINPVQTRMY